jgi:phosphoribosylglycinamide formyltransferase-1
VRARCSGIGNLAVFLSFAAFAPFAPFAAFSPPVPHSIFPRLAVLLSGSGRTLLNLLDAIARGDLLAEIPLVVASKECLGAQRAREQSLPTQVIPGDIAADRLDALLAEHKIDYVALAGYLRYLRIPGAFQNRIVNIHPALLPSFGGKGMHGERVHKAVLAHGCKVSGCTVHFVDDRYDNGPIIAQQAVPVLETDDARALAGRVFAAECELYPKALQLVLSGRVTVDGRIARIAGANPRSLGSGG